MGAFLDSAENIRQDKKSSSGQAHKIKKTLEKKEEQGLKMEPEILKSEFNYELKIDGRRIRVECLLDLEKKILSAILMPLNGELGIPKEIANQSRPKLEQRASQELDKLGISDLYPMHIYYLCQIH